jgi:hypothetical protein
MINWQNSAGDSVLHACMACPLPVARRLCVELLLQERKLNVGAQNAARLTAADITKNPAIKIMIEDAILVRTFSFGDVWAT